MRRRHAYTYGEYSMLGVEDHAVRHEFIDGEIVAMAGGSALHSALIAALTGELYTQLRGTECGVRESNLRVRVEATGNAFYPDALVVCGKADVIREIRGGDSLLNPSVLVEVLSPSAYDREAKFEEDYRFIPSLREYVLVAQDEPMLEVRTRDDHCRLEDAIAARRVGVAQFDIGRARGERIAKGLSENNGIHEPRKPHGNGPHGINRPLRKNGLFVAI